jgi:hypothetical protein
MTIATETTSRRNGALATEVEPRQSPAPRYELQVGSEAGKFLVAAADHLATVFEGARSRARSRGQISVRGD